jgi:APA family basic amino acid/polyamine antiporter
VIANIIGTGVFTSLDFRSPTFSPVLLCSCSDCWRSRRACGALCYGELSAALPRSGANIISFPKFIPPSVSWLDLFQRRSASLPPLHSRLWLSENIRGVFDFASPALLFLVWSRFFILDLVLQRVSKSLTIVKNRFWLAC